MNDTTDAVAIFSPLWSRKWLILAVGIVVAVASYAYYKHKPPIYRVSTELYIGSFEEQAAPGSSQSRTPISDRAVTDQATLINSNIIKEAVQRQLRAEGRLTAAKGKASANASSGSDFITISAEARGAKPAAEIANAYATAYIKRETARHRLEIEGVIARTRRQLRTIEASARSTGTSGRRSSARAPGLLNSTAVLQAATLDSKIDQLEAELSAPGVEQISPAKPRASMLVSPQPRRNAIFGLLLGLLLASFAAYVLDRFDRRLRSLADIEAVFDAQILTALPVARRPVTYRDGQPAPAEQLLEPLRRLHTTLQLGDMLEHDRERSPRVILFVSADKGDGRSTLIADLALVQRDAGERVAVVEADLRRPTLASLLGVESAHGLAEVLSGTLPLHEMLQRVGSVAPRQAPNDPTRFGVVATTLVESPGTGSLAVLAGGAAVSNPAALLARGTMGELLRSLAEEYDYVLVDAPSALGVSDALPLLRVVDGIVLVARVGHTGSSSAQRLLQLLTRSSSAPVLGAVAVGASQRDMRTHGLSSLRGESRRWLIGS